MNNPELILTTLQRLLEGREYCGRVSLNVIDEAESALKVRFPRSYRIFLENFGAALLTAPFEIYGLPPNRASDDVPPMWCHILDIALHRSPYISPTYIPVSDDGSEIVLYFDTARMDENDECPVVALGPGVDYVEVAPCFLTFVEAAVSGDPLAGGQLTPATRLAASRQRFGRSAGCRGDVE